MILPNPELISENDYKKCLEVLKKRASTTMDSMQVNDLAIMVVKEYLKTENYDEYFLALVERIYSGFNGDVYVKSNEPVEPLKVVEEKKKNPFSRYKI